MTAWAFENRTQDTKSVAAAQTAPAESVTKLLKVEGSSARMAMPSITTSEKQQRDTSVELMDAASFASTACRASNLHQGFVASHSMNVSGHPLDTPK